VVDFVNDNYLNKELQSKALDYLNKFNDCNVVLPIINSLATISTTPDNWVDYLDNLDQLIGENHYIN
jgi:hypothetical protein